MAKDPMEGLERQVRQFTCEVADRLRQVAYEQKMRGFLEDPASFRGLLSS